MPMLNSFKLQSVYSANSRYGRPKSKEEWIKDAGESGFQVLSQLGAIVPVSSGELDGFEGFFDFNEGRKVYKIEVGKECVTARPLDEIGSDQVLLDVSARCLRVNPDKIINFLAEKNGFVADPLSSTGPIDFCVTRKKIGAHRAAIVFVFNRSYFRSKEAWSHLSSVIGGVHQIIMVVDDRTFQPQVMPGVSSPIVISIEDCRDLCEVPRSLFCHPKFSISATEAAAIYPDKKIILDPANRELHISGTKIKFQNDGIAFSYAMGVCKMPSAETESEEFARKFLGHGASSEDLMEVVRNGRKLLKERLKSAYKNDSAGFKAASDLFLANANGTVKRPFLISEVLLWDENLVEC